MCSGGGRLLDLDAGKLVVEGWTLEPDAGERSGRQAGEYGRWDHGWADSTSGPNYWAREDT